VARSARYGRAAAALVAVLGIWTAASPPDGGAVELHRGETRAKLSGSLAGWGVVRLDHDTPDERPSGTLDLKLEADHGRRFHFFLETRGGFDGKIGAPQRDRPFIDLDEIYQDKDIFLSLNEAYLDVVFRSVEFRIGKQKVSWGRLDDIQPTDNLNPEDLTEFYFRPELERKIGIPAMSVTGYLGLWTAELVWNPFYTAYRLANENDRWFAPLLSVADRVETPLGAVAVRTRYPDVDGPPHTFASSDVALRVVRPIGSAQVSASVFHGWDKTATFGARGTATLVPTGDPTTPVATSADLSLYPTLHRITVIGADLAVPVSVVALRAEAAWIHGRWFSLLIRDQILNDPRLNAVVGEAAARVAQTGEAETVTLPLAATEHRRESVQYGIGVDYTFTEAASRRLTGGDWLARAFVLVQLLETVIVDHDAPFIDDAVEHLLSATLRQTFRDDRVLAELKLAYNPNHGEYVVWPQLTYKLMPALHGLFQARILGGSRTHTIGQYRDYDELFLGFRYYL